MATIGATLYIHAIRRPAYQIDNDHARGIENPEEFSYDISLSPNPWQEDGVTIYQEEVRINIPQVNVKGLLIERLKDRKQEILAESQRELERVDDVIRQLSALTYQV
jgi:hypothetical protein